MMFLRRSILKSDDMAIQKLEEVKPKVLVWPNPQNSIGENEEKQRFKCDISVTKIQVNGDSVDPFAFENCINLTEVILSDKVTTIGAGAFRGCSKLEKITIPASVKKIEAQVFEYCDKLKEITIEGRPEIGWHAFNENCIIKYTN